MKETLRALLDCRAERFAKKPAFVYWRDRHSDTASVTSEEFAGMVARLGDRFLAQGYRGRRIAILGENSFEWALAFFAVTASGNSAVLPDPHLRGAELGALLRSVGCDCLCFSATYADVAEELCAGGTLPCMELGYLYSAACRQDGGVERYGALTPSPDDEAVVAFTSGTSGGSRGVVLSHRSIVSDVLSVNRAYASGERALQLLPFFHMFGILVLLGVFSQGGTLSIEDSLRYCAGDIERIGYDSLFVVPAMLPAVCQALERRAAAGAPLPGVLCGGAPAEEAWVRRLLQLGVPLYNGYGMTECAPCIAIGPVQSAGDCRSAQALDVNEVSIAQPDRNGVGEILVRGRNVMRGYCGRPGETRRAMRDGWFHTGDLGRLEADGRLTVLGRANTLLVLPNGEKLSPEAVERTVMGIAGVAECRLSLQGGVLTLEVYAPGADEASVQEALRELNRSLPSPRRIMRIVLTGEPLAKSAIGKLIRNKEKE